MDDEDRVPEDEMISRRRWVGLLSLPAIAAAVQTALPLPPASAADSGDRNLSGARIFNIRDFVAAGDGVTLDTAAVQSAMDACTSDQGGIVLVPAGVFLIGTIELKSNVTLRIGAGGKLLGSADGKQYRAADAIPLRGDSTLEDGNVGLIFAVRAKNICIEGPGTIDGQGDAFRPRIRGQRPPAGISGDHRPHLLLFYRCENLLIRDIFLNASAYHCIRPVQCADVRFDGIHIYNRVNHNNDGFHFISCVNVSVTNCNVMSQDDACALFGSCQMVTITNCAFSTRWSVFRFGGGVAQNITVSNCLLKQVYGCPIKMRCGPGSRFENISFSNLVMDDVTGPISIGLGPETRRARPAATEPGIVPTSLPPGIVRNISFSHIRANVTASPDQLPNMSFTSGYNIGEVRSCIAVNGVNDEYLENISFDDVHITFGGGGTADDASRRDIPQHAGEYFELGRLPAYGMYARGVRGLTINNMRLEVTQPDLRPALVFDRVEDAAISGLNVQGNPQAESVLRFTNSSRALLTAARVLTPSSTFIRVEGAASSGIILDGGDLSYATAATALANGAPVTAIRVRT